MNQTIRMLRKARDWWVIGITALIGVVVWKLGPPLISFLLFFGLGSIVLFFEQDYHPWSESVADLAAVRYASELVADGPELQKIGDSSNAQTCLDFSERIKHLKTLTVAADTYCKIRVRTACYCYNGHWIKVHITRGSNKGADAWACSSAVSPSFSLP